MTVQYCRCISTSTLSRHNYQKPPEKTQLSRKASWKPTGPIKKHQSHDWKLWLDRMNMDMLVKTKGSCRTSTCLWWKNINLTKNNIHITTTETCWSKPRFSLKENMHEDWRNHQRGFTKFNIHTNYTKAHNSNCSHWSRPGCTYAPAPEE